MAKELILPPYPAQAMPGDYIWVDWWRQLQTFMREILAELEDLSKTWTFAQLGANSTLVFRGSEDDVVYGPVGVTHVGVAMTQGICAFSVTSAPLDNLPPDTPVVAYPGTFTIRLQTGGTGMTRDRLPPVSGDTAGCYVTITPLSGINNLPTTYWGIVENRSGDLYITVPNTNLVRNTQFIMHATGTFLVAME